MSYYPDLTPYNYRHYSEKELNIGWLQKDKEFTVGEVPEGFLDKLKSFEENRFFKTKGMHFCELCQENHSSSDEIRVVSNNGQVYASPTLIGHYIESHSYLPPQEFIEAVMDGPEPSSEEYSQIIALMPTFWEGRQPDENDEDFDDKIKKIMIDGVSESVDKEIIKDLLNKNPGFKKFVEGYTEVIPAVYGFNKKDGTSEEKS